MKHAVAVIAFCLAFPVLAQERVDLLFDLEGVHRTGGTESAIGSGGVAYTPKFDNGGGIGGGVNWFFSSRVSLELKIAALLSSGRIGVSAGPDFVGVIKLDDNQIYPITAVMQWHPFEKGSLRPYFGAGVSYVVLKDVEASDLTPEIEFDDPAGLVLNAGVRLVTSKRWGFFGDVKYIPLETSGQVRFGDAEPAEADFDVQPLVVGFGIAYHF